MLTSRLANGLIILVGLEYLNYLLLEPYLVYSNIFKEFISNSLIIGGIGIVCLQKINYWQLFGFIFTWIGMIGFVVSSDINLIEDGWIKSILVVKIFFVKTFWFWIGLVCLSIIIRSVYYDGILLIIKYLQQVINPEKMKTSSSLEFVQV